MKLSICLSALFVILSQNCFAQTHAVTDKGEEVILNEDHTWRYGSSDPAYDTRLDTVTVLKDKNATFQVKGSKVNYCFWIDPKKWKFKLNDNINSSGEYIFSYKGGDLMGMIIPERIEISSSNLLDAALKNAKKAAEDAHFIKQEIRKVNGHILRYAEFTATIDGVNFIYMGYYFSSQIGSIQLLTFTSKNLFEENKKEMETFLNGFDLLN